MESSGEQNIDIIPENVHLEEHMTEPKGIDLIYNRILL